MRRIFKNRKPPIKYDFHYSAEQIVEMERRIVEEMREEERQRMILAEGRRTCGCPNCSSSEKYRERIGSRVGAQHEPTLGNHRPLPKNTVGLERMGFLH